MFYQRLCGQVLAHAYVSAMDDALQLSIAHVLQSQQSGNAGPDAALAAARVLRSQVG